MQEGVILNTLDKQFTDSIQQYIKLVDKQRDKYGEHEYYYKSFNKMIATSLGLKNIKKDNLFNNYIPQIGILQELVINRINKHIAKNTDSKTAYKEIKMLVKKKAHSLKIDKQFTSGSPTISTPTMNGLQTHNN